MARKLIVIVALLIAAPLGDTAFASGGHPVLGRLGYGLHRLGHGLGNGLHRLGHKIGHSGHGHHHRG